MLIFYLWKYYVNEKFKCYRQPAPPAFRPVTMLIAVSTIKSRYLVT